MRVSRLFSNATFILAVVGLAAIPIALYYNEYAKTRLPQNEKVMKKVAELIILPKGEEPQIATVTDRTKLSPEPFFQLAETGDVLIVYRSARKAILYRPSKDIIVDVSPINGNATGTATGSATTTQAVLPSNAPTQKAGTGTTARVALYNGTKTAGLAARLEPTVESGASGVEVVEKTNAKQDYPKTVISALNASSRAKAELVAKIFKTSVTAFPAGEATPSADILVILGNDAVSLSATSATPALTTANKPSPTQAKESPAPSPTVKPVVAP